MERRRRGRRRRRISEGGLAKDSASRTWLQLCYHDLRQMNEMRQWTDGDTIDQRSMGQTDCTGGQSMAQGMGSL